MAKLAVLFFAALAFQAAFAGVTRGLYNYQTLGDNYGYGAQFEGLVDQMKIVTRDLSVNLENVLPTNRQVTKTLMLQCRELAQIIDDIINRLQVETYEYNGNVIEQVISELREIQVPVQQAGEYTDISNVSQLKHLLNIYVQNVAEQIEKLVRMVPVQSGLEQTQGAFHVTLKSIINEFLTTVQKIQTQLQYVGIQGQQNPMQLAVEIQEVTKGLVRYLQGTYVNTQQIKLVLREYIQNVEMIITKLQKERDVVGNMEIDSAIQKTIVSLRQILVPLMQITNGGIMENMDVLRTQLIRELEVVAEELTQLAQFSQFGTEVTLIQDVLYEYLNIIQKIQMQIQGGFLGQDYYGLYKYGLGQGDLLKQGLLNGKFYKYGKSGKGLAIQIQVVVSELAQIFQTMYLDNPVIRETFFNQFRQYIQELELIVEKFEQVNYGAVVDMQTIQNLREIVMKLRQILGEDRLTTSVVELRNELILYIQNFGNELQKLTIGGQYGIQQITGTYPIVKDVLVQYLIITRNLQVQLQTIAHLPQRGLTTTRFGNQIQILANGLISSVQAINVDNEQVREVLFVQSRELAQQIERILEKLQGETIYKTGYGVEIPQEVAENLRKILISLRQCIDSAKFANIQQLKMKFIVYIQEIATEFQKLLWVGQEYLQGQTIDGVLYDVLRDFVVTLQNQQIQLQNIFQLKQYGQGVQQLGFQIQAITNNLATFLQNVPTKGQDFVVEVRKLIRIIEVITERLEVEASYMSGTTGIRQVVYNLKQIVLSLERVTELETSNYDLGMKLNIALQNVAVELKKLSWIVQSDYEQIQGNLNFVVRSVLVQYLVVLQRVQIELQGINQIVRVGQTPRELALQVEIVSHRLYEILRMMVPDNKYTQESLVWQVRRFYQIIENIADRLQVQITKDYGKVDFFQQVIYKMNQIKMTLRQLIATPYFMNTQQLKTQLAVCIRDAAVEIQKLMWAAQYNLEGNADVLIKGVLVDFLGGLQTLQMQIQNNLQIVIGGQSPKSLTVQIQVVANRLFEYFQLVRYQPNNLQLREILIIQIGEFTQTVENLVQMLRAEIKNGGENVVVLEEIIAQLTEVSMSLQKITGVENKLTVDDLSSEFVMYVQKVVALTQRLAWIAQAKIEKTQVNFNGVLNGALNNFLATLRNMLIQLGNTQETGQYGQNAKFLANQIRIVSNKLTTSLQTVVAGTKQVKQTLAIQILKYVRRIQNIVDRLETETGYNTEMKDDTLRQVLFNLKQYIVGLQQVAESLVTKTTVELKNELYNYIQNIDAEIQKLFLVQLNIQQYNGLYDTVVRSVLIEYLAAVQNLQIRVQYISYATQKGLTLPELTVYIRTVVSDLTTYFQRIMPTNKLVKVVIATETREFVNVITNMINKLETKSVSMVGEGYVFQRVVSNLREIKLLLQRIDQIEMVGDIYQQKALLIVNIQRVAAIIEQLVWSVQPQLYLTGVDSGSASLVREILNDFLITVQNVDVQLQIVLLNGQVGRYLLRGEGLEGLKGYYGMQELPYYKGYGYSKNSLLDMPFYGREYIGGKYFGGLLGRQMIDTPQMINEVEIMARQLSALLQDTTFNGKQVSQVLSVQVRRFAEIIKTIIDQFQGEVSYKTIDVTMQQVISRMREVLLSLQKLAAYNTFTSVRQLKAEFDMDVKIVVDQIQKMVLVFREEIQGERYNIFRNVLTILYGGIQNIYYQLKDVTQYSQGYGFDFMNMYGKYDQGYGFGKYNKLFGYDAYDKTYGFGKYGQGKYNNFDYGYGKQDNYYDDDYERVLGGMRYGYNGEKSFGGIRYGFDEDRSLGGFRYGYNGEKDLEGFGLYNKYADLYKKYGFQDQYKYENVYDNEYGLFNGKYGYGLEGKYGYGLNDKYGYGLKGIKGQTCEQLVNQIRMVVNKIVGKFETLGFTDSQIRQVLPIYTRQLVQIVGNMIDRLETEVVRGNVNEVQILRQVIDNLKQIRVELQRLTISGVITTVYQIRSQFFTYFERIVVDLEKLVFVCNTDLELSQVVRDVLMQYWYYLRTIYYQYQFAGKDMTSQLVSENLVGYLRGTPYNTIQAQNIDDFYGGIESPAYFNRREYLPRDDVDTMTMLVLGY